MADCACRHRPGTEHFRHHDSVSCSVFSPEEAEFLLDRGSNELNKLDLLRRVSSELAPMQKWQRETYG